MLFTIQAYLQDYLHKRSIIDSDGYAVRLANLYFYERLKLEPDQFLRKINRIKTTLFINNDINNRIQFEKSLLDRLDKSFKKEMLSQNPTVLGDLEPERKKLQQLQKLTISTLLNSFTQAVQARGIDAYWESRTKNKLRAKPETIAQSHLALYTQGVLSNRSGIILREFNSGVGFVDIGVIFSSTLHLVELKILEKDLKGIPQLEQYMKTEKRGEGSLVVFDPLSFGKKIAIPNRINTPSGIIKIYPIDLNPIPPSKMN